MLHAARLCCVVLLALSLVPSATATSPGVAVEAPSSDVAAYQELNRVGPIEAAQQMNEAPIIGELDAELDSAFPSTFAGLWIDHEPYGLTVAFTDDADRVVLAETLGKFRLSIAARVQMVSRSMRELEKIVERLNNVDGMPKHDRNRCSK